MIPNAAQLFVGDTSRTHVGIRDTDSADFDTSRQRYSRLNPESNLNSQTLNTVTVSQPPDIQKNATGLSRFGQVLPPKLNKLIAEWQGRVVSIHEDYFVADVEGLMGEGVEGLSEEAIIPIMEVQEQDKTQFRVGAFFRLCINYQLLPNNRKARTTTVSFRRLPAYSTSELNAADERARDLALRLRVE